MRTQFPSGQVVDTSNATNEEANSLSLCFCINRSVCTYLPNRVAHIMQQRRRIQHHPPPHITHKNTRRRRILDLLSHIPTFIFRFLRLLVFVVVLLPAFCVFAWHYVVCDRVAVYYGDHCSCGNKRTNGGNISQYDATTVKMCRICKPPIFSRRYLDIYGSNTPLKTNRLDNMNTTAKPVVVFLTGGAWIIGYRMWGTLLGRALVPFGILVVVPDYRNFPRVNVDGMVQDVDMSIQWVMDNVEEFGGDANRVVLVGQSAGAHLGGVVVARKVLDWLRRERRVSKSSLPPLKSTYQPQQLCGFISTSSPHNLVTMREVFHRHGLSANVQKSIFGGMDDDKDDRCVFERWSPYHLTKKCQEEYLKLMDTKEKREPADEELRLQDAFPNLSVIHGTADKTVPVTEALEFISLLANLQIPVETKLYKEWSHTDPILEAPMRGNHLYHRDIYEMVCLWTSESNSNGLNGFDNMNGSACNEPKSQPMPAFDDRHLMLKPICPRVLVDLARICNPF